MAASHRSRAAVIEPRPVRGRATFVFLALVASSSRAFATDPAATAAAELQSPATPPSAPATPSSAATASPSAPPTPSPNPAKPSPEEPPPTTGDRALAAGASVVPGLLVHGMGHYV